MDRWYIWFEVLENGETRGKGMYHRAYKHKSSAVRRAKLMWGEELYIPMTGTFVERLWIVSQTNPWDGRYIFITQADAEIFVNDLKRLCEWYGCALLSDAKDLADKDCGPDDHNYAWFIEQLKQAKIRCMTDTYGYEVTLPEPLPLI